MSKGKKSTEAKSTTTTTAVKRPARRPRKSAATKAAKPETKVRITVPLADGSKKVLPIKASTKRPLGQRSKPAVNVAQLEKSLKEAEQARVETHNRSVQLERQLYAARLENTRLNQTIKHLRAALAISKSKEAKPSLFKRLTGRG